MDRGLYSPLEVSVETDKGSIVCRTYQINNFHACLPSPDYKLVRKTLAYASVSVSATPKKILERFPCLKEYLFQVVCMGAEQNGLPSEYLRKLKAIQTNNYSGPSILDQLKAKK